jgi:hypothetical protein
VGNCDDEYLLFDNSTAAAKRNAASVLRAAYQSKDSSKSRRAAGRKSIGRIGHRQG